MRFTLKLMVEDENTEGIIEEVIKFDKGFTDHNNVGLSLKESKQILKALQVSIILQQAKKYSESKRICPCCHKQLKLKGYHAIQYRTLFGIVNLESPRL